ncbi:MAG: SDR family NAD(P)-dependent oxidoreductase [Pseudomonadota bacterium]
MLSSSPRRYRTALVTGASSGIGEAFAKRLAKTSDLVLTARSVEDLERVRSEILTAQPERTVRLAPADLTQPAGVEAVGEAAEAAGVDLLVNNAGAGALGPVLDADPEALSALIRLNVEAPVRLSRALLPGMLLRAETGGGRAGLIDVASSAAFAPVPNFAAYAASKAFLLSFSEALSAELRGRPIDVLTLCPGATRSDFGARAGYSGGQLPFAADPDRVAQAALAAIGRVPTLATGPEGVVLTPAAAGRSLFAGALERVTGLMSRRGA